MKIWLPCIGIVVLAQVACGQQCPGDLNGDGMVTIDEIIMSVDSSLNGCPVSEHFTDNRDGTITDNQTRLMWAKSVQLDNTKDFANLQDADNSYPWAGVCSMNTGKYCQPTSAATAACAAGVEGDTTGCADCTSGEGVCDTTTFAFSGDANSTVWTWVAALNAANFGSHHDWRLAKRRELDSIIDYASVTLPLVNVAFQGATCGESCADVTSALCSCTQAYYYWSATTYLNDPGHAWIVSFIDSTATTDSMLAPLFVRGVRGGR